jgi:hypothetical protein
MQVPHCSSRRKETGSPAPRGMDARTRVPPCHLWGRASAAQPGQLIYILVSFANEFQLQNVQTSCLYSSRIHFLSRADAYEINESLRNYAARMAKSPGWPGL